MNQILRPLCCAIVIFCTFLPAVNAQFVNFEETWKEFLAEKKTSGISKLTKPNKADKIDYGKYALIYATVNFCSGNVGTTKDFISEIDNLVGAEVYKTIPGYVERNDELHANLQAYNDTDKLWQKFLKNGSADLEELEQTSNAKNVCEKGTLAKYSYMLAHSNYCAGNIKEAKDIIEKRVLQLAERTSLKVSDIPGLEERVKTSKQLFIDLPILGKAWKEYVTTDVSKGFDRELHLMECYPIPNMKEYVLRGAEDVCIKGEDMLAKIKALQENNTHPLGKDLTAKIKWLEDEVGRYNGDLTTLEKAWEEFMPSDTVTSEANFLLEYCQKDAQIKAYVMEGTMRACTKGREMLGAIVKIRAEHDPKLGADVLKKIKSMEAKLDGYDQDLVDLNTVWKEFIDNQDTLAEQPKLAGFYCYKIALIKSWTIKGHLDGCDNGQGYLDKIDALQKAEELEYDEELACSVKRLRIRVWDCRYWELVLQARKEANEEREKFGPQSASIMQQDLNGEDLPCETTVAYSPIGFIGVKYIITAFLCQDIDLANPGDPEYYKKIADWVDTEVLQKYCEADMRCKEEFIIYLEGHTDGNAFNGAIKLADIEIPEGTSYTHFIGEEVEVKTLEKEITRTMRSNMDLGLARAWIVKNQLEFMSVPITVGAYEHPSDEKGGEYRRVEIELNITKLLLDFYEKRLAELLEESGIGERPEAC